jgi:hypothetical protein
MTECIAEKAKNVEAVKWYLQMQVAAASPDELLERDGYKTYLLVGTQDDAMPTQEWKDRIWKCPSCKYWFPMDWNHDDQVCCACAGCTKHPFLDEFVKCHCPRCEKS